MILILHSIFIMLWVISYNFIKMARKYDRYGRNRQFRRNPTRSPKFFPYRLPFRNDFRLLSGTGTEVSAATASRWRQVVRDITRGELFDFESYKDAKRSRDIIDEFGHHNFNPRYAKTAQRAVAASLAGDAVVHAEGALSGAFALLAGMAKNPVVRRYSIGAVL